MNVSPIRCGALAVALLFPSFVLAQDPLFKSGFESCDGFAPLSNAIAWDGGGDGERWSDPLNWSGDQVPGSGSRVNISGSGAQFVRYDNQADNTTLSAIAACLPLTVEGDVLEVTGAATFLAKVTITGGQFNVNGDAALRDVEQSGGTFGGVGTVTVAGSYAWSAGTIESGGRTILNGGFNLSGGNKILRSGRTLEINSPTSWTGGTLFVRLGNTIENNDTFTIQTDDDFRFDQQPPTTFTNNGTLQKTAGSTLTDINANVINEGIISVDTGQLRFGQDFTQGGGGTLFVDIESETIFDVFAVGGDISLAGTVDIDRNPGYSPTPGPIFNFMTGTTTSVTATLNDAAIGNGNSFQLNDAGTSVQLLVVP